MARLELPAIQLLGRTRFRQRDANNFVLSWQLPALALAIFQAKLDRFSNIRQRFFAGPSLADAPRDNGAFGNDEAVFPGYKNDR
jgi:hypothetical protein